MSRFSTSAFILVLSLYTLYAILYTQPVLARVTPADILNERRGDFTKQFDRYSPAGQAKIQTVMDAINQANADSTAILSTIMLRQGNILDEYLSRKKFVETESIKDSRYWVTFAHEAIDYQKQRVYIPVLNGESNINSDLGNLLSNYKSQLAYARGTAVKSLDKLTNTIQGLGNQKVASQSAVGGGE